MKRILIVMSMLFLTTMYAMEKSQIDSSNQKENNPHTVFIQGNVPITNRFQTPFAYEIENPVAAEEAQSALLTLSSLAASRNTPKTESSFDLRDCLSDLQRALEKIVGPKGSLYHCQQTKNLFSAIAYAKNEWYRQSCYFIRLVISNHENEEVKKLANYLRSILGVMSTTNGKQEKNKQVGKLKKIVSSGIDLLCQHHGHLLIKDFYTKKQTKGHEKYAQFHARRAHDCYLWS